MAFFIKKSLPLICLTLLSVPLFFLNIHNGHSPGGDDYAQYIKEAQNIANGKHFYLTNYVFNPYNNCYSPPQYPPGFPLLLAPVVKIWGLNIRAMCYFNTIIAVCLLFCFYVYFRKYTGGLAAVCLSAIISYSGMMIDMKQSVLADEPCLLFVMIYLILRGARTHNWLSILLLGICGAMAILMRTQSILLLFAEALFVGISLIKERIAEKKWRMGLILKAPSAYVIFYSLALVVFVNKVVFYCPTSAFGFYVEFLKITLQKGMASIVRDNINFLLQALTGFFHYDTENSIRTAIVTTIENSGFVLCFSGFFISVARRLAFDDLFFILLCGLMLYYPIHDARYFLPAIAIVFYYCYAALAKVLPAITGIKPRYIALLVTGIYFFAGLRYLKGTTKPPYGYVPEQKDLRAFEYISSHVNDTELVICARPRLVTLYTNKRCMIHAWQYPMATNRKIFDSMNARYLLIISGIAEDYYRTYLGQYQHPLDSANIGGGYTLYKIR